MNNSDIPKTVLNLSFSDTSLKLNLEVTYGQKGFTSMDVPIYPIMEVKDQGLVEFNVQKCFNMEQWELEDVETVGTNIFKTFSEAKFGWINFVLYSYMSGISEGVVDGLYGVSEGVVDGLYALPVSLSDNRIFIFNDLKFLEYDTKLKGLIGTLSIRKGATSFKSENDAGLYCRGKDSVFFHVFPGSSSTSPEVEAVFDGVEIEDEGDQKPDYGKYGDSKSRLKVQIQFTYHPPQGDQKERYEELTAKTLELAEVIVKNCPPGMQREFALMQLTQAYTMANTTIATGEDPKPKKPLPKRS